MKFLGKYCHKITLACIWGLATCASANPWSDNGATINTTGNVGIGVASTSFKFHVSGGVSLFENTGKFAVYPDATGAQLIFDNGASADHTLRFVMSNNSNGALTERMRLTAGGTVGIGTLSPLSTFKLDVYNGDGIFGGSTPTSARAEIGGGSNAHVGAFTNHDFRLRTNNIDRVAIDVLGNVGIGIMAPVGVTHIHRDQVTGSDILRVTGNAAGDNPLTALALRHVNSPNPGQLGQAVDIDFSLEQRDIGQQVNAARIRVGKSSDFSDGANADSYLGMYTGNNGALGERMRITSEGKVGIGTTTPVATLEVSGPQFNNTNAIRITNGFLEFKGIVPMTSPMEPDRWRFGSIVSNHLSIMQNGFHRLTISPEGDVGIGVVSSGQDKMEVVGSFAIRGTEDDPTVRARLHWGEDAACGTLDLRNVYNSNQAIKLTANGHSYLNGGNVGIGTTSPTPKLALAGDARSAGVLSANSIRTTEWTIATPDYVFEPGYKLPSLESVEKHVRTKKHLPDIPSAAELEKEGIDLTEMNLRLLKKVE